MVAPVYMDNFRLGRLIKGRVSEFLEEQPGFWKFEYDDCLVIVVTDEGHNRMRIIAPVVGVNQVGQDEMLSAMTANFDRALDARYAINGDYLWSVYIHPLRELSDHQFLDAMTQVVTLAKNYGSSWSSGDLVFGSEG